MTLREKYIAALMSLGAVEVKTTSRKFIALDLMNGRYFVGKSGSLRVSRNKTISTSAPVSVSFKQDLLKKLEPL